MAPLLLPLRALPVNDSHSSHGRGLRMRVEHQPSGSAVVYVRRESDKRAWMCEVRSLQEILVDTDNSPIENARALNLDLGAVVTCLYNGIAYDAVSNRAVSSVPLELQRQEVAFTPCNAAAPTSSQGNYRLTMRISVRSSSSAMAVPAITPVMTSETETIDGAAATAAAIPVVCVADDAFVFGLEFTPTTTDLAYKATTQVRLRARRLHSVGVALANTCVNWGTLEDRDFLRVSCDGFTVTSSWNAPLEIMVRIVHVHGPALFVVSANGRDLGQPMFTTSYAQGGNGGGGGGGDLCHTVVQFVVPLPSIAWVQVAMLHGSAPALEGSVITLRELPPVLPH